MTLDALPVGDCAVITKVGGEGPLRLRLLDMGLIPRTAVKVTKIAPLGDPIELFVRGYTLTLRIDDAAKIEIAPVEAHGSSCAGCNACGKFKTKTTEDGKK